MQYCSNYCCRTQDDAGRISCPELDKMQALCRPTCCSGWGMLLTVS